MTHPSTPDTLSDTPQPDQAIAAPAEESQPKDSYVKLAMRNMVRKRGTSVKHFLLSVVGLLAVLIGLSYLTR
ncbi:DUF3285 domain-containing protein [Phormidium sp. CCY1219]|jgi:hypothetical protein|uniref:DUF3285 domain-containing protein n=1 Tax=Phormidium sp. CCY1219 TaxID=2886104 RepID=UPI002D1E6327|nr:DUF3285 domain-containing protein [Phormidium sp. CCY1219]MEB3830825.1 DUF3285 domain-containing protein [Phormidium sp. CCY1219]